MGRLPDNYFGPKQRVLMLKRDHPGNTSAILTKAEVIQFGESLRLLVKASVMVQGVVVAEGHAFTDPDEDKAVEKAETVAIGRALVNYGYPEILDVDEEEDKAAKTAQPKSAGLGGGKSSEKTTRGESKDEGTDSKVTGEVQEVAAKSKSGGSLGGLRSSGSREVQPGSNASRTRPTTHVPTATEKGGEGEDSEEESEKEKDDEQSTGGEVRKSEEGKPSQAVKEEVAKPKMTREELLAKYKKK